MEFYETVNNRRSIRDFTDEIISEDILKRIIEAAYKAPANDHFRDWHFVVITDKEIMRQVLEGVPKNLSIKDVDAMEGIYDPIQKESYRFAVPKQYRLLMRYGLNRLMLKLMSRCIGINFNG